jgi:hypothetical protein
MTRYAGLEASFSDFLPPSLPVFLVLHCERASDGQWRCEGSHEHNNFNAGVSLPPSLPPSLPSFLPDL